MLFKKQLRTLIGTADKINGDFAKRGKDHNSDYWFKIKYKLSDLYHEIYD